MTKAEHFDLAARIYAQQPMAEGHDPFFIAQWAIHRAEIFFRVWEEFLITLMGASTP